MSTAEFAPLHANRFHRYAVTNAAYLTNADEDRYVRITPADDGYLVDHGTLRAGAVTGDPVKVPAVEPERYRREELAAAVQRVCALAAAWLDFGEWEVEQTRRLFLATSIQD